MYVKYARYKRWVARIKLKGKEITAVVKYNEELEVLELIKYCKKNVEILGCNFIF